MLSARLGSRPKYVLAEQAQIELTSF